MADDSNKTFLEWKNRVYRDIRTVENLEDDFAELKGLEKAGCFGKIFKVFIKGLIIKGHKSAKEDFKEKGYPQKADTVLSDEKIKKTICSNLTGKEKLPIDIANVITEVLYNLPPKEKQRLNLNSMIVAYMCFRLSKTGVTKYCKNTA